MSISSTGLSREERARITHSGGRVLEPITVSIREAQRLSGLSRTTLHRLAVRGRLRTIKVLKRRLVDYASLKALLTPNNPTT